MNTGLHALLDRAQVHAPEYAGELSNHLPMALHALAELGADEARLESFFAGYARRFAEGGSTVAGFDDARAAVRSRLREQGRDATLRAVLPALWPGVAAAAFHGLIRTAHAVQAGHDDELASGLAYWQVRSQAVPMPDAAPPMPLDAWGEALEAEARLQRSSARLITARIAEVGGTDAYRRLAGALAIEPDSLAPLHRWCAGLYAATGNFTVLHLVTGTRALRVLAPWIDDRGGVLRTVVPAVAAGVLASGLRERRARPEPHPGWPEVIRRAIAQDDEHVIKLVHACMESARLEGDEPFLAAAGRAVS